MLHFESVYDSGLFYKLIITSWISKVQDLRLPHRVLSPYLKSKGVIIRAVFFNFYYIPI